MKNIFAIILLFVCLSASAQTTTIGTPRACTPTVTVNCNLVAVAEVPTVNAHWVAVLSQGNTSTQVPVNADGKTFNLGTLTAGLDYTVSYYDNAAGTLGCGYSTYFLAIAGRITKDCTSGGCTYTDNACGTTPSPAPAPTNTTQGKGRKK